MQGTSYFWQMMYGLKTATLTDTLVLCFYRGVEAVSTRPHTETDLYTCSSLEFAKER